jgi:cytochrome c oxidase assembly protein Cox11
MKFRTLKILRARRNARRIREKTDRWVQALIIILALVMVLLVGCSYRMVPNETKIEYGTTETDSKNNKLQQKQSITQSWKWEKQ